jgi:putative transposase
MSNHYHLVVETPDGNLSQGMRQLNGVFTQASNRRHGRTGHLFQGRFKAILVDKDSYLLELTRYVVLNPVRAGLVEQPGAWPWSSYRAMAGEAPAPTWLATEALLAQFGSRRSETRRRYRRFVCEGRAEGSLWSALRQQIYLGSEEFVERMQERMEIKGDAQSIPTAQRRAPTQSLEAIAQKHPRRDDAIVAAYATGGYSATGRSPITLSLHLATAGRIIRAHMQRGATRATRRS